MPTPPRGLPTRAVPAGEPRPPIEGAGGELIGAMVSSGYFFNFLKLVETVCGLLLLIGLFVPLVLVVLAPIVLNILLFHVFMAPAGLPMGIVLLALGTFLAYSYRSSYRGVLARKAEIG